MQDKPSVIDGIPGLVWSAGPDGLFTYINQRWREYTGVDLDQVSGTGWYTVVHPEDLPDLLDRWRACGPPASLVKSRRVFGASMAHTTASSFACVPGTTAPAAWSDGMA